MENIRKRRRRDSRHFFTLPAFFLAALVCISIYLAIHLALPTGWVEKGGQVYYRGPSRAYLTGWQEIDGRTYYFCDDGALLCGWLDADGKRFHFAEDGAMDTGWLELDDQRYYLTDDGAATGWQEIDGQRYYFQTDGACATGWLELDSKCYYLLSDGKMATSWQAIDEKIYYFSSSGEPASGWQEIDNDRYYFGEELAALTGWQEIDGQKFYFAANGAMATGLTQTETGIYYFDTEGIFRTGWITVEQQEYYFSAEGPALTGKQQIDGQTYYFTPKGVNVILVNPWNSMPSGYSADLVAYNDYYYVDSSCLDALNQMLDACRADGNSPAVCSAYRTQADQEYLYARKVEFYTDQGYSLTAAQAEAGTIVAVPGTSEHQLGLALDIVDTNNWHLDETQATMPTQIWLMEHCWEYGFILRYPDGSSELTGIIYEPWHYRYVGVDIAMELRDLNITLEEYLGAV